MKRITHSWVNDNSAQAFMRAAQQAGFEAYFVGGCVRNALLGLPVSDLDIATSAHPDQVIKLAKSLGFKSIPTGIDHGTIAVVGSPTVLEITTFRKDVETDGRRAVVAFADSLEDDAQRRDFRMNALYADFKGQVSDPTGGLADISAKRICFVGNAGERIREDYLRIIRLFRFAAQLGFGAEGIDIDALEASRHLAQGLAQVSIERKTAELMKLLAAPDPSDVLLCMASAGVLEQIVPDVQMQTLLQYIKNEDAVSPLGRLAAATHNRAKLPLRLSKRDSDTVQKAKALLNTSDTLAAFAYKNGAELAEIAYRVKVAKQGLTPSSENLSVITHAAKQVFPITAVDLMPKLSGKALGDALKRLERDWIRTGFKLGKAALLAAVLDEE